MAFFKEPGIFAAKQAWTGFPSNEVAQLVSGDSAQSDQRKEPSQVQLSGAGKNSSRHQQGIAGQEKADEHPGFHEDDNANHERPAPIEQAADVVKTGQNLLQNFDHLALSRSSSAAAKSCKSYKHNSIKARRREP